MKTIKDIAQMAGVSPSTVSRVLNNYPDIGPETRQHVWDVIHQANFAPNSSARRLVQKQSRTLGLMMCGLKATNRNDTLPMQLLKGALLAIEKTDYDLIFIPTTAQTQKERPIAQFQREYNLAGLIFSGLQTDDRYYQEAEQTCLPCVTVDFSLKGKRNFSVLVNNFQAAYSATLYLIEQKHRHIGIVCGKENTMVGLDRYCGYCQALLDHGIPLRRSYVVRGEFSETVAYERAKELLCHERQITALFCSSDVMALGVYRAAQELGRGIPESLSIVAFDDFPLAPYMHPPLTTVRQHFDSVGAKAVRLLIDLLEKKEKPKAPVYSTYELIVRHSVRRLPDI